MKKIITLIILLFSLINIYSQDFPLYNMELIKTFLVGAGNGELITNITSPYDPGPPGIGIDDEGNLYICDPGNFRVIKFDNNLNFNKNYLKTKLCLVRQIFKSENGDFIGLDNGAIYIYDSNANQKGFMSIQGTKYDKEILGYPNWIYYDDILFTHLDDGSLISIPYPENDKKENIKKVLNEDETIKYLQEKYGTIDSKSRTIKTNDNILTIDESGNIIVDREIQGIDYNKYYEYWEKNIDINDTQVRNSNKSLRFSPNSEIYYLGKDIDNNSYWIMVAKYICVYDNYGNILSTFEFDTSKNKLQYPAIHPSGDVYFLDYDDKQVYLYRIKRVW